MQLTCMNTWSLSLWSSNIKKCIAFRNFFLEYANGVSYHFISLYRQYRPFHFIVSAISVISGILPVSVHVEICLIRKLVTCQRGQIRHVQGLMTQVIKVYLQLNTLINKYGLRLELQQLKNLALAYQSAIRSKLKRSYIALGDLVKRATVRDFIFLYGFDVIALQETKLLSPNLHLLRSL